MSKKPKGYPAIHIINSTGYSGTGKVVPEKFPRQASSVVTTVTICRLTATIWDHVANCVY